MPAKKVAKPRHKVNVSIDMLGTLLGRVTEDAPRMSDRFDPDFIPDSQSDMENLRNADAGRELSLKNQTSTTGKFRQFFDEAIARLVGVHEAVRRLFRGDKHIADMFGLGVNKNGSWSFSEVLAGLDLAINAFADHPDIANAAKMRQRDIDGLRTVRANLMAAAANKQNKVSSRLAASALKTSLHLAVERRIDEIISAARLEFAAEPERLRRYLSVIPTRAKKVKEPIVA